MDADKISRILSAKARIEEALTAHRIAVDASVREAIGWQMRAMVDNAGIAVNDAADQIIADYLARGKKAA